MQRSGTADLPLHGGRVPLWFAQRMTQLGTAIAEHIVISYGPSEFLTRLSDPFWFQAFGCVMGMDWHSSGITTSVMGERSSDEIPGAIIPQSAWSAPAKIGEYSLFPKSQDQECRRAVLLVPKKIIAFDVLLTAQASP